MAHAKDSKKNVNERVWYRNSENETKIKQFGKSKKSTGLALGSCPSVQQSELDQTGSGASSGSDRTATLTKACPRGLATDQTDQRLRKGPEECYRLEVLNKSN